MLKSGHEAVIEHCNVTSKFICDRGVTHEIVRHRLAGYCQESTRYCNYGADKFGGEITFIDPWFWSDLVNPTAEQIACYAGWKAAMQGAESVYLAMIKHGATPQEARSVLPNSTKTELVMTANMREWRHFFKLRTSRAAHPQMREVACMLLMEFREKIPVLFDDVGEEF
jgi:thymidylate synthase (FAD)